MKPKVSVIVPCYNSAKTVERTLDCLVNQTLGNLEIIVVNDGSQDNTWDVLNAYKEAHPQADIQLYQKENEGIAAARSFGITKVHGEYFGWLDSDDYTDLTMYEKMVAKADAENLDLVVSHFKWVNSQGERIQKEGPYEAGPEMMANIFTVLWNKLYRTDWIRSLDVDFPYGDRYEDTCYLYCLCANVRKVGFVDEAFVSYVQQENSITHTNNNQVKNMVHVSEVILDYYRKHDLFDQFHDALEYIMIRNFLGFCFVRAVRIDDPQDRRNTILLGWNLLNREFPEWPKNPYLRSQGGMKNRYFRMVRGWNLMGFAWLFRHFKPENL